MSGAYATSATPAATVVGASKTSGSNSVGRIGGGGAGHGGEPKLVNTDAPDDEDEKAGDLREPIKLDELDPLDKGLGTADTGHFEEEEEMDLTPSPMMTFPLLDIEPNSVTSLNTEDWMPNLIKRTEKPKINFKQLAYESVVANIQGHKRAYNSKSYGELDPVVDIKFHPKKISKKIWKVDAESLQDSLAESSAGWRKSNAEVAADFKRNMRTFILPNSHYHGGPTMFKRGLNQFRNKAIRSKLSDPDPDTVEVAVQNAKHAFALNNIVLYGNDNVRLQFKSNYNQNAIIPDSSAQGDIPPPTTWFGVQSQPGVSNASSQRQAGFSRTTDQRAASGADSCAGEDHCSAVYTSGAFPQQFNNQSQMAFAPSQRNTGAYATHATNTTGNYAPPGGGTAPQTVGL